MIKIKKSQMSFIFNACIELSHAMGRLAQIGPSICFIGSNRISEESKNSHYYELALETSKLLGLEGWSFIHGGSTGINEATTRGAHMAKAKNVAIRLANAEFVEKRKANIRIKVSNPFNRKVLFDLFSNAYVFFPGGYGTLETLFETLTLQQTRRTENKPIICVGEKFWKKLLTPFFDRCLSSKYQTISPKDLDLITYTDDPKEIATLIRNHRGEVVAQKGEKGIASLRRASSKRAQSFSQKVGMELVLAFNTFHNIGNGLTIFGSSRTMPESEIYYETLKLAQELGRVITQNNHGNKKRSAIITGGGPGNMEAANKGARLSGAPSIGLGINIPNEQGFNPYVDPGLAYEFDYFFCRKWLFSALTHTFIATPGGFGTFDELFEMLCNNQLLLSTRPELTVNEIYCIDSDFWFEPMANLQSMLIDHGFISENQDRIVEINCTLDQTLPMLKEKLLCAA